MISLLLNSFLLKKEDETNMQEETLSHLLIAFINQNQVGFWQPLLLGLVNQ